MTFSPLADMSRRIPDVGRSSIRNASISAVILHHNAGIDAYGQATAPGREVSANYWVTNSGVLLPNIPEEYRAWTTGHPDYPAGAAADHRSITFEISNSAGPPDWPISAPAMNKVIDTIADIGFRYGWPTITRGRVTVHRDFVNTECPGPYIMSRLGYIINEANARLQQRRNPAPPAPPKKKDSEIMPKIARKKQYNSGQKIRKGSAWTTLKIDAKGNTSVFAQGAAFRRGIARLALHADRPVEVRMVYVDVSKDGRTLHAIRGSVQKQMNAKDTYEWPFDLKALPANATRFTRLRFQARSLSANATIHAVLPMAEYWED